jgi:hypothetical protein
VLEHFCVVRIWYHPVVRLQSVYDKGRLGAPGRQSTLRITIEKCRPAEHHLLKISHDASFASYRHAEAGRGTCSPQGGAAVDSRQCSRTELPHLLGGFGVRSWRFVSTVGGFGCRTKMLENQFMQGLSDSYVFWVLLFMALVVVYLLPTLVGLIRGVDRMALVFLVNRNR